ncbi:hypothetical protein EU245_12340 [Lentibacillus lipolyticus]|nr:hypothetical protein EU245_12340 [Lentibacillus lipolyticus]
MKVIQTFNDLEWLKATQATPKELVQVMEEGFHLLFEANNECEDVMTFRLPKQEALILLEAGDEVLGLLDDPFALEFVEKGKRGRIEFYRIAKRGAFKLLRNRVIGL